MSSRGSLNIDNTFNLFDFVYNADNLIPALGMEAHINGGDSLLTGLGMKTGDIDISLRKHSGNIYNKSGTVMTENLNFCQIISSIIL